MGKIKTSKLISQKDIATSITVSPAGAFYVVEYFLKERNKNGSHKKKRIIVDSIVEDVEIPEISNWTVKHLGYNTYKHYKTDNFYINFYKR